MIHIVKLPIDLNKFILDTLKPSTGLDKVVIGVLTLPIDCEVVDSQI